MKLLKNLKKSNNGITLIALVITIIVLLILAGVSIAMLTGENGILTQASNASKQTEIAQAKERAKLDILDWRTNQIKNKDDATLDAATIKGILSESATRAQYIKGDPGDNSFFTLNGYEILYSELDSSIQSGGPTEQAVVGEKVTGSNKEYTKNGTAVIPVGFTIVPGCNDISQGLVISDNENDTEADPNNIISNGNQFVWVPVSKTNFTTEFVRHDFGKQGIADSNFVSGAPTASKYAEYTGDGETVDEDASESVQEAQRMYRSVKQNGGFYIGRYEAGNDGSNNVLCKKNANVYNYIGWSNSDNMTVETGGAVEKARGFDTANSYTSVTSTLVYGVQWDAVMRWINNDENLADYLKDSSDVGHYNSSDVIKTGSVEEYQMKNIFDMAGNVWEWTMEAYSTGIRVFRGGRYYVNGSTDPVTFRNNNNPSYYNSGGIGFRVALYL